MVILEIMCMPIAVTALTLYVVVVAIDTTSRNVFGDAWRLGPL
jgi:hypothetical protein